MNTTQQTQNEQTEQNLISVPPRIDSNGFDITEEWQARELFLKSNKNKNAINSFTYRTYSGRNEIISDKISTIKQYLESIQPEETKELQDLLEGALVHLCYISYKISPQILAFLPHRRREIVEKIVRSAFGKDDYCAIRFLLKHHHDLLDKDSILASCLSAKAYRVAGWLIKGGATFSKCSEDLLKKAKRKYKFGIRSAIENFEREQKIKIN